MKKIIAASVLCLSSGLVSAENYYASVAYSMLDAELSSGGSSADSEPTAFNFFGGVSVSENFAVEGVIGFGLSDDGVGSFSGAEFELDSLFGLYGVGILPVTEEFNVYAKLGLATIKFNDVDSDKSDGTGLSYGLGAEVKLNEKFGAAIEYIAYPDAEYSDGYDIDVEASAIALRLNAYF